MGGAWGGRCAPRLTGQVSPKLPTLGVGRLRQAAAGEGAVWPSTARWSCPPGSTLSAPFRENRLPGNRAAGEGAWGGPKDEAPGAP